jgi:uncharacterized protein
MGAAGSYASRMTVAARLSIVTLGVADLARSVAFYEALGWSRMPGGEPDVIEWFATSGSVIGLFPHDELAKDAGVPAEPSTGFRGVTLAMNFGSEGEVDAAFADAIAAGASSIKTPIGTDWGGYSGYFGDPDGHYWEVAFAPGIRLDAEGRVLSMGD